MLHPIFIGLKYIKIFCNMSEKTVVLSVIVINMDKNPNRVCADAVYVCTCTQMPSSNKQKR